MGLDWNPLARPKPGSEGEFERLLAEIDSGRAERGPGLLARMLPARKLTKAEIAERRARFQQISEPPFATMGAPRVGFDEAADAWLRKRLEENGKLADLEEARRKMHGYHVLDLLPPCDGFARYSNGGMYDGVDRCSFRAQFLDDVETIIGPLHGRAYKRMTARELAVYADELYAVARKWAISAGVAHVEHDATAVDGTAHEDDPMWKADILFSAIRWCRFWAARGHGLEPWF